MFNKNNVLIVLLEFKAVKRKATYPSTVDKCFPDAGLEYAIQQRMDACMFQLRKKLFLSIHRGPWISRWILAVVFAIPFLTFKSLVFGFFKAKAKITVIVQNQTSQPLASIPIVVWSAHVPFHGPRQWQLQTNADGRTVLFVPQGLYGVHISSTAYPSLSSEQKRSGKFMELPFVLWDGDQKSVVLTLPSSKRR
jgi:hypothetical protein